jgi:hypothetical protein
VNMIYLLVDFFILRVMIRYHIMIPLSPLSSLIIVSHQIFVYVACIIYDTPIVTSLNESSIAHVNAFQKLHEIDVCSDPCPLQKQLALNRRIYGLLVKV